MSYELCFLHHRVTRSYTEFLFFLTFTLHYLSFRQPKGGRISCTSTLGCAMPPRFFASLRFALDDKIREENFVELCVLCGELKISSPTLDPPTDE